MSLIVDIDPVPWNILEVVKCRILKNRAKAKRAVENCGGSEEKRADSLRPGPLSIRRKDEPSFVLSGDTPYIAIVTGGQYGTKYISGASYTTVFNFGNVPPTSYVATTGVSYSQIGNVTVKLNGITIGDIQNPGVDKFVVYLFVWSNGTDIQEQIKSSVNYFYANRYELHEVTRIPFLFSFGWDYIYEPDPNTPYLVKLNWKVILVDSDIFPEPQRGDKIKLDLIPESSVKPLFYHPSNIKIWSALVDDEKSINWVTSSTYPPAFSMSGDNCQSFTLELPIDLGNPVKFIRLQ